MTVKTILATLEEIKSVNECYQKGSLLTVEMFRHGDQFMNLCGREENFPEIEFNVPLFVIKSYLKGGKDGRLDFVLLIKPKDKIIPLFKLHDRAENLYLGSPLDQLHYLLDHYNEPIQFIIPSTVPNEVETYEQLVLHQTLLSTF